MSLNYSLINNSYTLTSSEAAIINGYVFTSADDWQNPCFNGVKNNLKLYTILAQQDRCAYCRKLLEADGYYEPIEHVVPKTLRPRWILIPQNLILTCDRCNNLKSNTQTLADNYLTVEHFPLLSEAFKIFNPHFDRWEEHLQFENEVFLVPIPNSKGAETIKICKLYKYHIIVNRAKELKLGHKEPLGRMIHRLKDLDRNSDTYTTIMNELTSAMLHFNNRVQDQF